MRADGSLRDRSSKSAGEERMEFLMFLETFAMVLALFASAVSVMVWALRRFMDLARASFGNTENPKRRAAPRGVDQWNPNHPLFSKRAGQ